MEVVDIVRKEKSKSSPQVTYRQEMNVLYTFLHLIFGNEEVASTITWRLLSLCTFITKILTVLPLFFHSLSHLKRSDYRRSKSDAKTIKLLLRFQKSVEILCFSLYFLELLLFKYPILWIQTIKFQSIPGKDYIHWCLQSTTSFGKDLRWIDIWALTPGFHFFENTKRGDWKGVRSMRVPTKSYSF